jgi:hypothetical protein
MNFSPKIYKGRLGPFQIEIFDADLTLVLEVEANSANTVTHFRLETQEKSWAQLPNTLIGRCRYKLTHTDDLDRWRFYRDLLWCAENESFNPPLPR